MLELRDRLAGMLHIRVRHRRVFAHDVHSTNIAGMDRLHDFHDGQAALGIELCTPQLFELGVHRWIFDRNVIGIHHRYEAGVRRPLHVVLSAQWMQPRSRPADMPGHQRQRNQAARVVGAVRVL